MQVKPAISIPNKREYNYHDIVYSIICKRITEELINMNDHLLFYFSNNLKENDRNLIINKLKDKAIYTVKYNDYKFPNVYKITMTTSAKNK